MIDIQYDNLTHTLQTVAFATLIFVACALFPTLNFKLKLSKLPGTPLRTEKQRQYFLSFARKLYRENYNKFKDSVYRIATADGLDTVVVPISILPELRRLPDDFLSVPMALNGKLESKYTLFNTDFTAIIHAVQSDLTPSLNRLNADIYDEVVDAMGHAMSPCKEWTGVNISQALATVVARVSGRVFVGPELCRDPEYIDCAINYTKDVQAVINAVKQTHPWLRPLVASRLPEVKALRNRERRTVELLEPIIRKRQEAEKNDPNWKPPYDMMQWVSARDKRLSNALDIRKLVQFQLQVTFAAVQTTTDTATNIFYTLAVKPEYVDPLRQEIRQAMAENDGLSFRALQKMEKLDSFMKEVIHHYPFEFAAFSRRVLKGITLSNGQYIPPGVIIETAAEPMYRDSNVWADSDEFDGFRHYKLRRGDNVSAAEHARNQFVSSNEKALTFGYGRHACPGRFFAANEIKMIVATFLLNFDIKMPEGHTERYAQIDIAGNSFPDSTKEIMVKNVQL